MDKHVKKGTRNKKNHKEERAGRRPRTLHNTTNTLKRAHETTRKITKKNGQEGDLGFNTTPQKKIICGKFFVETQRSEVLQKEEDEEMEGTLLFCAQ